MTSKAILCSLTLCVAATGCVVGDPQPFEPVTVTAADATDPEDMPAALETLDDGDIVPEVDDRALERAGSETTTIAATANLLANPEFNDSIYYSGSDYRRWRAFVGVTGNHINRAYESAGGWGARMDCIDNCFFRQRVLAVPNQKYQISVADHGYYNDGSPRQRVALWFYDINMNWLGGTYTYVEDTSGSWWIQGPLATAPANTYYAVVEVHYDSDANERSRFFYANLYLFPTW